MPYCTSCGTQLQPSDKFCARCGAQQTPLGGAPSASAGASGRPDPLRSLSPRTASILCYVPVLGWIMAVIVLASPLFAKDRTLRFHAFQGIYLFVVWLLIQWVLEPMFAMMAHGGGRMARTPVHLLEFAVMVAWVWMLVKTSQNEVYSLPFIGELAQRSVEEQR